MGSSVGKETCNATIQMLMESPPGPGLGIYDTCRDCKILVSRHRYDSTIPQVQEGNKSLKRNISHVMDDVAQFKSSMDATAMFMQFDVLPDLFTCRNHIMKSIFIRPCYPDLYNAMIEALTIKPISTCNVIAVLGTVGIGTSTFFLYCLDKYLKKPIDFGNKTGNASFYFQTAVKTWKFYDFRSCSENGVFEFSVDDQVALDSNYPLFADLDTPELPEIHLGVTLIFTSFRAKRYKEFIKEQWQVMMPTWSLEEFKACIESDIFKKEHSFNDANTERLLYAYSIFGGVIRESINCARKSVDPEISIDSVVFSKGRQICEQFFKSGGFEGSDEDINDILIHRNPTLLENGKIDYLALGVNRELIFSFASSYVYSRLAPKNSYKNLLIARERFLNSVYGGADDCVEFGKLCFFGFRISDVTFTATHLQHTMTTTLELVFPPIEILPFNWKDKANNLQIDKLYIPALKNLDAFCLKMIDGVLTLVVLQVTIAEHHSVKSNVLQIIYEAFEKTDLLKGQIKNSILIYVTPKDGKLKSLQNLVTKENKVMDTSRPMIENQFKIENHLD